MTPSLPSHKSFVVYKLDRIWRTTATGISFTAFFVGGLLLSLTFLPLIHMGPGSYEQKCTRVRKLVRHMMSFFVGLMSFFGLIKVNKHNIELLRNSSGCLVLANHPTLIDVVILVSECPNANCIVKGDLFRNKYLKRVMSYSGFIGNDNGIDMLQSASESLKSGDAIVMFPEGSRSVSGKPLQFRRGAANIAVRSNAPILSVFITCKPITLMKGDPWYKIPEKTAVFDIWVKEWISPQEMVGNLTDLPAAARKLTDSLQHYFDEGLKNYE